MPNLNKTYSWAIETCNAPSVGYSQTYRNQQTVNGITYYDCSSFINYALLVGGWVTPDYAPTKNAFTTHSMPYVLVELGFTEVDPRGIWLPGDIGLSSSHTEMVYKGGDGGGVCMGAHTSNAPLQYQVSIGSSAGDPNYISTFARFPRLFRYGDGGATGFGCSLYVVAAICGNMVQESNINPGLWESLMAGQFTDLNKGFGLGQWTNTGGDTHGRLYQLSQYLSEHGYAYDDGNGQLEYFIHENTWYPNSAYPFNNLTEFLQSDSTDIEMLTHAFNQCWEGIRDASWNIRVDWAKQCYDFILLHANDVTINTWITGNRYLESNDIFNNAVMVYRYLSAGGGGGGTDTKRKRKMPVWMMIRYK